MRSSRHWLILIVTLSCICPALAQGTRVLRDPAVSAEHVAFVYANDIWLVSRDGGEARRLTIWKSRSSIDRSGRPEAFP